MDKNRKCYSYLNFRLIYVFRLMFTFADTYLIFKHRNNYPIVRTAMMTFALEHYIIKF